MITTQMQSVLSQTKKMQEAGLTLNAFNSVWTKKMKQKDIGNKRESKQIDRLKNTATWRRAQRFSYLNKSPPRSKLNTKNNANTPMTQTTWSNSVQKQAASKISSSAMNIYRKYLTIQKETENKNPSVSINEVSKTLSIDTFNTEQMQETWQ